jgi:hypothetical protein
MSYKLDAWLSLDPRRRFGRTAVAVWDHRAKPSPLNLLLRSSALRASDAANLVVSAAMAYFTAKRRAFRNIESQQAVWR